MHFLNTGRYVKVAEIVLNVVDVFTSHREIHQNSKLARGMDLWPVTGGFPSQRASNAENVSIWWHHHDYPLCHTINHLESQGHGPRRYLPLNSLQVFIVVCYSYGSIKCFVWSATYIYQYISGSLHWHEGSRTTVSVNQTWMVWVKIYPYQTTPNHNRTEAIIIQFQYFNDTKKSYRPNTTMNNSNLFAD